eukprot:4941302-Lingulodinium_polyedra.AAC.1
MSTTRHAHLTNGQSPGSMRHGIKTQKRIQGLQREDLHVFQKKEDAETCVRELDEGSESLMKSVDKQGGSERQPDQNGTSTCS